MSSPEHIIGDDEILEKVQSLVGKGTKIVDCQKKSSQVVEEVVLLNGTPVKLVGEAGERIKDALRLGQAPPPELLGEILLKAGIETSAVELETVATVKSSTKTSEFATVRDKDGLLVDEHLKEFEEDDEFEATSLEVWQKDQEWKNNNALDYGMNKTHHEIPKNHQAFESHMKKQTAPSSAKASGPTRQNKSPSYGEYNYHDQSSKYGSMPANAKYYDLPVKTDTGGKASPVGSSYYPHRYRNAPAAAPRPDVLKREENFKLPDRIVYETFI